MSHIRPDSLEEYDAGIDAEMQVATAFIEQAQKAQQADPDADTASRHAEQALLLDDENYDDSTHPVDIVDIRGRIQTVRDLNVRLEEKRRVDVRI